MNIDEEKENEENIEIKFEIDDEKYNLEEKINIIEKICWIFKIQKILKYMIMK